LPKPVNAHSYDLFGNVKQNCLFCRKPLFWKNGEIFLVFPNKFNLQKLEKIDKLQKIKRR